MFQMTVRERPLRVLLQTAAGFTPMEREGDGFAALGTVIRRENGKIWLENHGITEENAPIRLKLRWNGDFTGLRQVYHDTWQRACNNIGWAAMQAERLLPWYFLATDGVRTYGCGVKTGSGAFAFWQLDTRGVTLWLDVRCGGMGVLPKEPLCMAELVAASDRDGETPYRFAQRFAGMLCDHPRLPKRPMFGANNWYYAYGDISRASVRQDAANISELVDGTLRPYMLIDDGWQKYRRKTYIGGPWTPNERFGDMAATAEDIRAEGAVPGIWMRPTLVIEPDIPESWKLRRTEGILPQEGFVLDPTVPEALERIRRDVAQVSAWGYGLIKHDFSAYDLLGMDGTRAGGQITPDGWHFADRSVTSAQVMTRLYTAIQEAAGEAMVMGCCTVNHLTAGIHEIMRSGGDTSGRVWEITRVDGISTLALRLHQNGRFFMTDADCAAFTPKVSTEMNLRFADLIARSGTALFCSLTPGLLDAAAKARLRESYGLAAQGNADLEPVDWMTNLCPEQYLDHGKPFSVDWYTPCDGVRTFYTWMGDIGWFQW